MRRVTRFRVIIEKNLDNRKNTQLSVEKVYEKEMELKLILVTLFLIRWSFILLNWNVIVHGVRRFQSGILWYNSSDLLYVVETVFL